MKKWNDKTTFEKMLDILSGIATCIWVVCNYLVKSEATYISIINYVAISVICICQGIAFWKIKRAISYIAFAGLALMLTAIVLEVMLLA